MPCVPSGLQAAGTTSSGSLADGRLCGVKLVKAGDPLAVAPLPSLQREDLLLRAVQLLLRAVQHLLRLRQLDLRTLGCGCGFGR